MFAKKCILSLGAKFGIFFTKSLTFKANDIPITDLNLDFIRHKTLELCAYEIHRKNIVGNVAELGVYKGNFAAKINQLFPNRKLYLFDTFKGFDNRNIQSELKNNFSNGKQDFSDTSRLI